MVRECAASLLLVPAAGCSLILDFSDGALPRDAGLDAPYSAAECAYREPNDAFGAAAAIAASDTGPAAICAGAAEDRDFYGFTVPAAATRVEIRLGYTYRQGDLDLRLYDRDGVAIATSREFTDEELIACPGGSPLCPALAEGSYVFEVFPATTGAVNRYSFALTISM
jgi:hypothetical protein